MARHIEIDVNIKILIYLDFIYNKDTSCNKIGMRFY